MNEGAAIESEVDHLRQTLLEAKTNQALILSYLAAAYLRGDESVKEYSVAVDALGRPPEFDPHKDSIVRVEIYKLRRLLKEYYSGPGRDRPVRLSVAAGRYALAVEHSSGAAAPPVEVPDDTSPPRSVMEISDRTRRFVLGSAVAGLAGVVGYLGLRTPGSAAGEKVLVPQPGPAVGTAVRILCGQPDRRAVDSSGLTWEGDRFVTGGRVFSNPSARIHNTPDQALYQGHREGDFVYAIPLPPGDYEVRLHFAETVFGKDTTAGGGEASRVFQVLINEEIAIAPLDVVLHAGGSNLALVKTFPGRRPAADGFLRIRFESLRLDKAFVNAIEVVPGFRDRLLPLRIVAGSPHSVMDSQGQAWLADRFVVGGRPVERPKPVDAPSPQLFRFERFGRFEYNLPASPGHRFLLRLWMAEQYVGVTTPGGSRERRLFDIYANGRVLLYDFSLVDAAKGSLKAVERSFHHLAPNAQGNLHLLFVPSENYALVNALELIDEGPDPRLRR